MSDRVIRVGNLGKRFRIGRNRGSYRTLREAAREMAVGTVRRAGAVFRGEAAAADQQDFWALRDVSFEVGRGEVVGVIGRNGAGKSTLLKVLSRITAPTEGEVRLRGRVGSLLEVGTGFHPELTGRDNIYLSGAIQGMRRAEIRRLFDDIVEFAEIGPFVDTPVKHYSSGMYLRLGFAVAAHLTPEILIVDEVLAVGDAQFQQKCMGKMGDLSRSGRTVLFVSHNMAAVHRLCHSAVWLDGGRVRMTGPSRTVVDQYVAQARELDGRKVWADLPPGAGGGVFRPISLTVRNPAGEMTGSVLSREPFTVDIEYEVLKRTRELLVALYFYSSQGDFLFMTRERDASPLYEQLADRPAGRYAGRCAVPADLFAEGRFLIGLNADIEGVAHLFDDHAVMIEVDRAGGVGSQWMPTPHHPGFFRPLLHWDSRPVAAEGGR